MQNFIFNTPTKIYFGKEEYKKIGQVLSELGYKKVMIQFGKGSAIKSGLLSEIENLLNESGISCVECGGVEPNPKLSFIRNATELAIREKVDFILAVGGGSAIDSSKYTALSAFNNCDAWDFILGKVSPKGAIPLGVILTISAAGSEMSSSAVLTNEELNIKKGFTTEFNRPKISFLCPELTFSVNTYQTACGVVDIMAHTMERYFTNVEDVDLTDGIAEALLKTVVKWGEIAIKEPENYTARANLMWASSLSHNGLTGAGRENYLAVHQLEHALSGVFDSVAHGAGLSVLFPAWAKFIYKYKPQRFARFAKTVFNVEESNPLKAAFQGILKMENFFKSIGMPTTLRELGIYQKDIETLALNCSRNKTITVKNYIPLGYTEIKQIFEICL